MLKDQVITEEPIKEFWFKTLTNSSLLRNFISEKDIPILKHLTNVFAEISEDNKNFKISLEFEPNEFFEDTKLEKEFIYADTMEDDAPS